MRTNSGKIKDGYLFVFLLVVLTAGTFINVSKASAQDLHRDIQEVDQSFVGPFDGDFEHSIKDRILRQTFVPTASELSGVDIFTRKISIIKYVK